MNLSTTQQHTFQQQMNLSSEHLALASITSRTPTYLLGGPSAEEPCLLRQPSQSTNTPSAAVLGLRQTPAPGLPGW